MLPESICFSRLIRAFYFLAVERRRWVRLNQGHPSVALCGQAERISWWPWESSQRSEEQVGSVHVLQMWAKKKKSARKDAGRNTKTARSSFYPFSIWKKKCFDCCFSVFFSAESKLSHKETSKQTTQAGRFTGRRTQLMDLFIFPLIFQTILFSDRRRDVKRLFYIHNKNASADNVV